KGILDQVEGTTRHTFSYRPRPNKLVALFFFFCVQCLLFWRMLRTKDKKGSVVYVNTLLPFGAILGARLAGMPVVCHVHEVSVKPVILNRFLKWVARKFAQRLIFVSKFVAEESQIRHAHTEVIPNALSPEFCNGLLPRPSRPAGPFRVLMLASIRAYKGLRPFAELARRLPEMEFELVLNGTQEAADAFFAGEDLPQNLTIWPAQSDVHPFYARAHAVLNLSLPDGWVETFGMTALEAMVYGIPVIVPEVGGIAEVVEHEVSGFQCSAYDLEGVVGHLRDLEGDLELYARMSEAAKLRAGGYRFSEFVAGVEGCLGGFRRSQIGTSLPPRDSSTTKTAPTT
ncbi:MAG: glycosyltransferase family 4 protein, partial [Bacteroidota bacterium]